MPADRRFLAVAALSAAALSAAALSTAETARAEEDDHVHGAPPARPVALNELTAEQRRRAQDAFAHIVCKCPSENWSKTLAMCPDACANQQKVEVVKRVLEDWSRERIVDEQVARYGPKAAANPVAGIDPAIGAGALLAVGAIAAALALAGRRRRTASGAQGAVPAGTGTGAGSGAEHAAVEKELGEVE